jgi:tRNA threonylcarbamoyladenosine biosynthesis protein TsaB
MVSTSEEMARGQAERLIPLIEDMLESAGLAWRDLCRIGVGVGPGNFTGIRIGVSAARGLALGLDVPAIGVSGFEARAAAAPSGATVAIPAPRGQVYVADPHPRLVEAALVPQAITDTAPAAQAEAIARIAAARDGPGTPPPAPLYVRAADAAPARDLPPVLLDP